MVINNRLIIQFGLGTSWTLYTLPITYTTCYSIAVGAVGDTRAVGSVIVEQSNLAQFNLYYKSPEGTHWSNRCFIVTCGY